MTHLNLAEGAQGVLRGRCVKWTKPGFTVEGVVTFINLESGALAVAGKPGGLVQIYDPTVPNQSEGGHGPYRRISLEKKALRTEVERCIRSGLEPGWHLQLTFVKNVPNKNPGKHPWKSFASQLAPPTLNAEQIAWLIQDGERRTEDNGSDSAPAESDYQALLVRERRALRAYAGEDPVTAAGTLSGLAGGVRGV